jgi:hypothetical protein
MTKKEIYIQFRIDELLKKKFKQYCAFVLNKPMSQVIKNHIKSDLAPLEPKTEIESHNTEPIEEHFEAITNLDYVPELRSLLIEYIKGRDEENACLSEECLLHTYWDLEYRKETHLLIQWKHFQSRIKDEWSNDNDLTEGGVV